mmetsp:Transcript_15578/g.42747  ORF Transcript_15578/g.42747 Transcript_15578/m.42747 type:complete len:214 (-) Transcript_15578:121-762(-)
MSTRRVPRNDMPWPWPNAQAWSVRKLLDDELSDCRVNGVGNDSGAGPSDGFSRMSLLQWGAELASPRRAQDIERLGAQTHATTDAFLRGCADESVRSFRRGAHDLPKADPLPIPGEFPGLCRTRGRRQCPHAPAINAFINRVPNNGSFESTAQHLFDGTLSPRYQCSAGRPSWLPERPQGVRTSLTEPVGSVAGLPKKDFGPLNTGSMTSPIV